MLTKEEIEAIKLRSEGMKEIIEIKLSKRNPYELLGFLKEDIDKLIETLQSYMSPYKITMKKPPWPCTCGGEMRTLRFLNKTDKFGDIASMEATCDKCGEKVYS
jgi:hypothetical protein